MLCLGYVRHDGQVAESHDLLAADSSLHPG